VIATAIEALSKIPLQIPTVFIGKVEKYDRKSFTYCPLMGMTGHAVQEPSGQQAGQSAAI
jgi:hypothetical protein